MGNDLFSNVCDAAYDSNACQSKAMTARCNAMLMSLH